MQLSCRIRPNQPQPHGLKQEQNFLRNLWPDSIMLAFCVMYCDTSHAHWDASLMAPPTGNMYPPLPHPIPCFLIRSHFLVPSAKCIQEAQAP